MGLPAWIEINGNRGELVEPWRGSVAERWTPYAIAKALGIDRHTAAKYVTAIADLSTSWTAVGPTLLFKNSREG